MTGSIQSLSACLLAAFILSTASTCRAFSITRTSPVRPASIATSNLFRAADSTSFNRHSSPVLSRSTLFTSPDDSADKEVEKADPADVSSSDESANDDKSVSNENEGGAVKTVLLAVPLFFKFAIVLIIKFLTDLVVFPLLFLYRMVRLAKRRVIRAIWGPKDDGSSIANTKPNGEAKP